MSSLRGVVALVFLAASVLPGGDVSASTACAGAEPALASVATALDEGRWDDADGLLQSLATSHLECGRVILNLARLRAAQEGDPAEVERLFSRALMLAPDDAVAPAVFARFQLSRGLGPQAAYLVAQSLAIDPDCVEALVVRGQILGHRGLYGESRAVLEKAVALDPTSGATQEYVASVIAEVRQWGFDYLKLDFLYAAAFPGRHESPMTREAAYREGLSIVREAAGDDCYLLACGAPIIASVGIVDGIRLGPDVAEFWHDPQLTALADFSGRGARNAIATSSQR
ncbi:MAG: hypothetical protein IFJ96_06830, partial [Acidobacteria bacterium]|nr:hypothetical protein [Candidatus Sulfomarinibacter sp. MAG AM2]